MFSCFPYQRTPTFSPRSNPWLLSLLKKNFPCSRTSHKYGIAHLYSCCFWLLLHKMFLRSIHILNVSVICSWVVICYMTISEICLSLHLLMDIWVVSTFGYCEWGFLEHRHKHFCDYLFSFLLNKYLAVELLGVRSYVFNFTRKCFFSSIITFYISMSNIWDFWLHSCQNLVFLEI